MAGVIALFTIVSSFIWAVSNAARLERDDFIAALFCSVKKTLAMGVPLAQLIFGAKENLGLILLPIMFYHPFQLFVCGLLASRFSNQKRKLFETPLSIRPDMTANSEITL
jgi:sodium/bile acid cotransporter 7